MGKQISYYMEYGSFRLLAQKALDLGCEILREDIPPTTGSVARGRSLDVVTESERYDRYYFHVPEAGDMRIETRHGRERVDFGCNASGSTLIEAGYSVISHDRKTVSISRLFCDTGYWDENGQYRGRPECVTKVYDALARYVRKIAPYRELIDTTRNGCPLNNEWRHKEYVTDYAMALREAGYTLRVP